MGEAKEFGLSHLLPQGLEIESAELSHESRESDFYEAVAIHFDPISDPMVIEAIKNLRNLFIVANILVIEEFPGCLFEVMHNFDRDIAGGDSRTF